MRAARLAVSLALTAAAASAAPYHPGEKLVITGVVSDRAGNPLGDVHVVLEASRRTFSLRQMSRVERDAVRRTTTTNARGEYSIEWPWDGYYNHFELQVGVPVRTPEGERLRVLERVDLSRRMRQGSPVVSAVTVRDVAFLDGLRAFQESVDSPDERRVYEELGKPDRVVTVKYPDHEEVSWWYFEAGKTYRFRDGGLVQVESFEPVEPF